MSNGTTGGVVPGQTPGTTPPFASPTPDDTTKKLLEMLTRSASTPQMSAKPVPMPVPGRVNPQAAESIGMNTEWPHAWGFQRFAGEIAGNVRNAIAAQKEKQVSQATADWEYLKEAGDELEAAKTSGDQKGISAAQSKVQAILGDPKKVKRMQKALQMSWLDPSKTDAYTEGLNRMMKQSKEEEMRKKSAADGIKRVFSQMKNKISPPTPKLTPDEQSRMSTELYNKIPLTRAGQDAKSQLELARTVLDIEKAANEARQKYQYVPTADGKVSAINKNDFKDAHVVKYAETGEDVQAKQTGKQGPIMQAGIPIGVWHNGKPVLPGDADWTDHDQKMYDGTLDAAKEKQMLRMDPIIAGEIGVPPDPKDFAKGRSDPGYGEALKKYMKQADKIRLDNGIALASARGTAYNATKPVQVIDYDEEGRPVERWTTAGAAISQGLAGGSEGTKLTTRESQMTDIEFSSKKEREAITNLDKKFTPAQIAKLYLILHSDDETLVKTESSALAADDLTDKQMDFVVWTGHLNERAMSLRTVAGMGQGAQDLRNAIRGILPGLRSGNNKLMMKQLDAFDNQTAILHKGIPKAGRSSPGDKKTPGFKQNPDGSYTEN
jgi:hypothetical protein